MAITLRLTDSTGTTSSRTVDSGASIAASPDTTIQVVVDGQVIDPASITRSIQPPDVTLTLPDGQSVTVTGFIDLTGTPGGGLAGEDGAVVIASSLEALSAPAAGATPAGADSAGANNISTFNQALIGALGGAFGEGTAFDGLDPAAVLGAILDSTDPTEFLAELLTTLGVVIPAATPVVAPVAIPVVTPAAAAAAPAATDTTTDDGTTDTTVPPGPPPVILNDIFTVGPDGVDFSDFDAVLTAAGLDPTDPSALGTFLLAVAAGFNISAALAGNDTVQLPNAGSPTGVVGLIPTFDGGAGDDTIYGGPDDESILGGTGNDVMQGRNGDDSLFGGDGNDKLDGDNGNDVLYGGLDDDTLFGDQNSDTLFGDEGTDTMFGGAGSDTFGLEAGDGSSSVASADLISDFMYGTDLIGLAGGLTFADLFIDQSANVAGGGALDTVIIDDNDGSGSLTAGDEVLAVLLDSTPGLSAGDFVILP